METKKYSSDTNTYGGSVHPIPYTYGYGFTNQNDAPNLASLDLYKTQTGLYRYTTDAPVGSAQYLAYIDPNGSYKYTYNSRVCYVVYRFGSRPFLNPIPMYLATRNATHPPFNSDPWATGTNSLDPYNAGQKWSYDIQGLETLNGYYGPLSGYVVWYVNNTNTAPWYISKFVAGVTYQGPGAGFYLVPWASLTATTSSGQMAYTGTIRPSYTP